ncbi:MAG: hypothetical protein JWP19_1550 [Rhodoglobus sp.]|nr:hypothetical protein [Rhodoglobus sp.]
MTRFTRTTAPVLIALAGLALAGCTVAGPTSTPTAAPTSAGPCETVTIVVDFGVLDHPSVKACTDAGVAAGALKAAGITTEGTVDYGDQVICRVNGEPAADETVTIEGQAPFTESCQTLNAAAYWALWVKTSADSAWEYAQEGAATLKLTDGQSVGLVYTAGTDSTPPKD